MSGLSIGDGVAGGMFKWLWLTEGGGFEINIKGHAVQMLCRLQYLRKKERNHIKFFNLNIINVKIIFIMYPV